MKLVIEDEDGNRRAVPFLSDEITVGRGEVGNTVALEERTVSRRHARFVRANGALFVEDLGSKMGTRVNGERIATRRRLRVGDLVEIGEYDLALQDGEDRAEPLAGPPPLPANRADAAAAVPARRGRAGRAILAAATILLAAASVAFLAGRARSRPPVLPPSAAGPVGR